MNEPRILKERHLSKGHQISKETQIAYEPQISKETQFMNDPQISKQIEIEGTTNLKINTNFKRNP